MVNYCAIYVQDFVGKLLIVDPSKRMTAKQALEHPWMLNSGKNLAKNDLGFNQEQLRVFNATSKLRAAIKSVRLWPKKAEVLPSPRAYVHTIYWTGR